MPNAILGPFPGTTCADLLERMLSGEMRVMLFGASGIGKKTLAAQLCRALHERGHTAGCLSADLGLPGFGAPGAVSLAQWDAGDWRLLDLEPVCSLDAARFRLPLITAVDRLLARHNTPVQVFDAPGLVRGAPGAELLEALVQQGGIDLLIALPDSEGALPLVRELSALPVEVRLLSTGRRTHRIGRRIRTAGRTRLWNAYLANAIELIVDLEHVPVLGTPPPVDVPAAWHGRQVGLVAGNGAGGLAEVVALEGCRLRLRAQPQARAPKYILVRDAVRDGNGHLVTAKPFAQAVLQYLPPPDVLPFPGAAHASGAAAPVARVGPTFATLVNGIFGDPLLHLRLRHERRGLLFDLGDTGHLPARIAHQVTDIFITHAHFDHIGGFLWLLRSRLGDFPVCRLYGPPGLAGHVEGMLRGILWDRIGARAPRFEVVELHGGRLLRWQLRAGDAMAEYVGETVSPTGLLREEPGFSVHAVTLDHGTPVLAFAFELPKQLHIRKDRLRASGLPPGLWLSALKSAVLASDRQRAICLPNGACESAGALADTMVRVAPGVKLVYATDFADSRQNRALMTSFAHKAHTFFCEASFLEADQDQALRTGHLTARACGEIATAADVTHLVPFHFSHRYENDPQAVYAEVGAACTGLLGPGTFQRWIEPRGRVIFAGSLSRNNR